MKTKIIAIGAIVVLAVGAVSFYGGLKYQQSRTPQRGNFFAGGGAPNSQFQGQISGSGRAASSGIASGEIIAKDDKSLTLKIGDSGSRIIFYAGSTQWQKMTEATAADFSVGQQVMVSGTTAADGSIVAKQIQLRAGLPAAKP